MKHKSRKIKSAALVAFVIPILCSCSSYENAYEEAVYDQEPVYCYRTLAAVDCYRKPDRRSDARLVNYYGPSPGRTRPAKAPPSAELQPPPAGEATASAPSAASEVEHEKAEAAPSDKADETTWRQWLPFISLGFGALQVLAAFVL